MLSCESKAGDKTTLETPKDKHSYAIGMNFGDMIKQNIKHIDVDLLDYSILMQGIRDQLDTSKNPLLNDSAYEAAIQDFMLEMRKAQATKEAARDSIKAAENLAIQSEFFEKNKKEMGVVTTASGLQYMVLAEGSGNTAKDGDIVTIHYTGTLLDGTKFDSSIDRNEPVSVPLQEGQMSAGWIEILRLMKKGDKVKVWIPSNLGFGEASRPGIPGNSMLIFDINLLDIKAAK
jgi:FKBP-type peptidyl-prolyl cis-trans isomerase